MPRMVDAAAADKRREASVAVIELPCKTELTAMRAVISTLAEAIVMLTAPTSTLASLANICASSEIAVAS